MMESERMRCLKIIDSEPELPGPMPDELWVSIRQAAFDNDKATVAALLRATVRSTKKNIHLRIEKMTEPPLEP